MNEPKLFVVACIPALNEEAIIGEVISASAKYVEKVIVCDDGSSDSTSDIAAKSGALVIRNETNLGKGASVNRLFKTALDLGASIIVSIDADGQHDPNDIPKLLQPIIEGRADVVIGSRFLEKEPPNVPLYRRFGLYIINSISATSSNGVRDTQSGLRAFSVKAINVMLGSNENGYGIESEQLYLSKKHSLKVVEIPTVIKYSGLSNTSKMNPFLHSLDIFNSILRFMLIERPLLLLGVPGFIISVIGFLLGLYTFQVYEASGYFSIPLTFFCLSLIIVGVVIIVNAFILHSLRMIRDR